MVARASPIPRGERDQARPPVCIAISGPGSGVLMRDRSSGDLSVLSI